MTLDEMRVVAQRRERNQHLGEIREEGQRRLRKNLFGVAQESNDQLKEIGTAIRTKCGCGVQFGPIKTWASANRKLKSDYSNYVPEGDWLQVKDLVRMTLLARDVGHCKATHEALQSYCGVGTSDLVQSIGGKATVNRGLHLLKDDETTPDRNKCGYSGINCVVILRNGQPGEIQVNIPEVLYGKGPKKDFCAAHTSKVWSEIRARYQIESSLGHGLYEIWREAEESQSGKEAAALSTRYYRYLRGAPDFKVAGVLQGELDVFKAKNRESFHGEEVAPPPVGLAGSPQLRVPLSPKIAELTKKFPG